MRKKRILWGLALAIAFAGLICLALHIFQDKNNQILLSAGLMCNSIAFVINCIANRKRKE